MTTTVAYRPAPAPARPAHRDGNVLRWLGAYTASMVGDSVYYIALSWAAVQAGTPAQAGLVMAVERRAARPADARRGSDRRPVRAAQGRHRQRRGALRGGARRRRAAPHHTPGCGCWRCSPWSSASSTPCSCRPWAPCRPASPAAASSPGCRACGASRIRFANVVGRAARRSRRGARRARGGVRRWPGCCSRSRCCCWSPCGSRELPAGRQGGRGRRRPPGATSADGLRYIRGHRVLAPLMVVIALSDLGFVGPLNVGLALLADERGWGASGMGWVARRLRRRRGRRRAAAGGTRPAAARRARPGLRRRGAAPSPSARSPSYRTVAVAAVGGRPAIGLLAGLSGALCGALAADLSRPRLPGPGHRGGRACVSLGIAPLSMPLTGAADRRLGHRPGLRRQRGGLRLAGSSRSAPDLRRAELPSVTCGACAAPRHPGDVRSPPHVVELPTTLSGSPSLAPQMPSCFASCSLRSLLVAVQLHVGRVLPAEANSSSSDGLAGHRHHRRAAVGHRRLAVRAAQDQADRAPAAHQPGHPLQAGPQGVREDRVELARRPVGLRPAHVLGVDVELDRVRRLVDLLERERREARRAGPDQLDQLLVRLLRELGQHPLQARRRAA